MEKALTFLGWSVILAVSSLFLFYGGLFFFLFLAYSNPSDWIANGINHLGNPGLESAYKLHIPGYKLALMQTKDPNTSNTLFDVLHDPDGGIRRLGATGLKHLPPNKALAGRIKSLMLAEKHGWTQSELVEAYAHHAGDDAIPMLISLAKGDLSGAGFSGITSSSNTECLRSNALDGLLNIGDSKAELALTELTADPVIGHSAALQLELLHLLQRRPPTHRDS
jgi:hypothetical protein